MVRDAEAGMSYICPTHNIPQTYGEFNLEEYAQRERERGEMLRANGRPEFTGALTAAGVTWGFDIWVGYRCWYCGALSPRGRARENPLARKA